MEGVRLVILHTNDFHGKFTESAAAKIAELRASADFYFDCGDCVGAGNIAVPRRPDPAWELLARAGCTASVPGNREFHISERGFRAKLAGCRHPVLAANLYWNRRPRKPLCTLPLPDDDARALRPLPARFVDCGRQVGVFGLMVPMVTERMAALPVSAFFNTPPLDEAPGCIEGLRKEFDVVICLSHIGLKMDLELAEQVRGIDVLLGGHSHDALAEPVRVGNTWVCQAGSHGRFVGRYVWDGRMTDAELIPLPT